MAEEKCFQNNDVLNYYLTMNMNNICRVCLEKGKLMPIFDPVKPPHFSILMMACAQVQVTEGDGLPPFICHKCVSKLNTAFQFKTQCESSDARLRNCFINSLQINQQPLHNEMGNRSGNEQEILNQANIAITFEMNNTTIDNNCPNIEPIQAIHAENPTNNAITETNQFGTITNDTAFPDLEKVALEELKIEFNDLQQNDTVSKSNVNVNLTNGNQRSTKAKGKKNDHHQCGTCGKVFRAKPSLVHHIRIHTGERPYTCHLCNKRFMNGGHLHTHMRTHTGEKNHVCAGCHKAFATAQQLTKHTIAVHTSERPYACNYCTKRFASSSNLRAHVRIHTGEKNYRCDQCGKAFCTKGQLEQHMLTHTGEKAFLCEYCHKRFTQKCHLLRHLKTHRVP